LRLSRVSKRKPVSEVRVIKKYPNRRLYDTEVSKYITLEHVHQLVLEQVPFVVQDAKSKADITRSILLQIIMEREEGGQPLFSEQVLSDLIRFYGGAMQAPVAEYFERSVSMLVAQQSHMHEQMRSMMGKNPLTLVREATEKNFGMWREMQENFLRASGLGSASGRASRPRDD